MRTHEIMCNFKNVVMETTNMFHALKMSKADAMYTDNSRGGEKCKNCVHFINPKYCEIVDGTINPSGWCRYFEE